MTLIPKGKDVDWDYIWQKQTLYPELAEELLRLAYCTHVFLMKQANGGIVRTISRTIAVWKSFQDYNYSLSDSFVSSLVSVEESKTAERAAKRAHKFDSQILSYGDCSFIKGIADYIEKKSLPSVSQCKRLVKIVNKAEDKGYIMPNS